MEGIESIPRIMKMKVVNFRDNDDHGIDKSRTKKKQRRAEDRVVKFR